MSFLKILEEIKGNNRGAKRSYRCQCVCGKEKVIRASTVDNGKAISCGCKKAEMLSNSNTRRALSFYHYRMRWNKLEELGARSPSLQKYLSELAKEYPVYV